MRFKQENDITNHIMLLLPLLVICILLVQIYPYNKQHMLGGIFVIYVLLIAQVILHYLYIETLTVTDTTIVKHNGFRTIQQVDFADIQFILSRNAYISTRIGQSTLLSTKRVLDFYAKDRKYLRIVIDDYDVDYIEEVVLETLRKNKNVRIYINDTTRYYK